jgi:alpha-glucoside transport system substrate-binding protein
VTAFEAGETDLYQGDLLTGLYLRDALHFEEWLVFERQRLRDIYQSSLEHQLGASIAQDDSAAVVITAQQLLKLDNLRADWHYALIRAYARLGKRSAALEQYELCRQMLSREWDMQPDAEIVRLAAELHSQRSASATSLRRSPAAAAKLAGSQAAAPDAGSLNGSNRSDTRSSTAAAVSAPPAEPASRPQPAAARSQPGRQRHLIGAVFGILVLAVIALLAVSRLSQRDIQASSARPYAGKTVIVMGPFQNEMGNLLIQAMAPFEERTGIDVLLIAGNEQYIAEKIAAGETPDIASFPQPGRLAEYAQQGKVVDLHSFLSDEYLQQQYSQSFLDLATYQGQVIGVWYSAGLKSLVWYPKQAFEARGYTEPQTWDELIALSEQIVADGDTPWCIGVDDDGARGWIGTDWVEDILLRTAPPETYDAWVRGELPFSAPEVRGAFEMMGQIWLNDAYVYGGRQTILQENFLESPAHLFDNPPGCFLHRQASFGLHIFPQGVQYGKDVDFFYLPPIDPKYGKPVLGGGDIFAMLNDRPEVRELMRYLTTPESAKVLVQQGGFISAHKNTPLEWFPTTADLRFAEILLSANTYRFDGSDMMPGRVGFSSFYRGITDFVEGKDLDTILAEIDASWAQEP